MSTIRREIEDIVKIQIELLEDKKQLSDMKNTLNGVIRRFDTA